MRPNKSLAVLFSLTMALTILGGKSSHADFTYTVKSGDSLYTISTTYASTITGIKTQNKLTSDNIFINQKLVIPTTKFTSYTVVSGDTLWKIGEKFKVQVTEIQKYNPGLTATNLLVGSILVMPVSTTTTTTTTTTQPAYRTHTVVAGDTLWGVSVKYNVTISEIKTLNNLTLDYLTIGTVLKLPAAKTYTTVSEVRSGVTVFPFKTSYTPYDDNYGIPREWSPTGQVIRTHDGLDIMASTGTPVYAVSDGVITRMGWNEYGGYRLMIKMNGINYSVYYAHFSRYATGMYEGKTVRAGELIGYVGSTGYGPEGTSGKFVPHLHIGIYRLSDGTTLNPYPYMKAVE